MNFSSQAFTPAAIGGSGILPKSLNQQYAAKTRQ